MSDQTQRSFSVKRLAPLVLLICGAALFLGLGGHRYVSLSALAEHREWLTRLVAGGGLTAALCFIAAYAGLVALSVPGAAIFTIASGFLFGPWLGTGYAIIGATVGATGVFLAARVGLAG